MAWRLSKWPALGKDGRAWVRDCPEPEDKGQDPQCFVCGRTLQQHGKIVVPKKSKEDKEPQQRIHAYCIIPESSTTPFCEEKQLRSKWARMNNRLYKHLAADMGEQAARLHRRAAR